MVGYFDCTNEPLGASKCGECLDPAGDLLTSQEGLCSVDLFIYLFS